MKRTNNKSSAFRSLICTAVFLSISVCLFVSVAFAWFVDIYNISDNIFKSGQLDPLLEVMYWDKSQTGANKWQAVSTQDGSFAYPDLGEVSDIATLPPDCTAYLKIKLDDNSGAIYKYDIFVDSIQINVYDSDSALISAENIPFIDYYQSTPSQACFDFYQTAAADNLDPTSIFDNPQDGQNTKLSAPDQSLTGNDFVASGQWLYIMLVPTLGEFQNIFKCIPTDYMPYTLEFVFSISGQSRTVDNE